LPGRTPTATSPSGGDGTSGGGVTTLPSTGQGTTQGGPGGMLLLLGLAVSLLIAAAAISRRTRHE
jgi:hypothetical protein